MAKKSRKESNKRFFFMGSSAKYTIELNGLELAVIAGALKTYRRYIKNDVKKMTPKKFVDTFGWKDDGRIDQAYDEAGKILKDLEIDSMSAFSI